MTPYNKKSELLNKFLEIINDGQDDEILFRQLNMCVDIVINEILDAIDWHEFEVPNKEIEYWQETKKINRL